MRRVRHDRIRARRAAAFGKQAETCRLLPCCVCKQHPSEPHHEPPRSVGGLDRDCLPLCRSDHERRHREGRESFWSRVGIDPQEVLARVREMTASAAWWRNEFCSSDARDMSSTPEAAAEESEGV
jgi:hypothetical protein